MPYDKKTGIITSPKNTWDVGPAIQSSSNDIGKLCVHENIDKWKKYKPVRANTWGPSGKSSGNDVHKTDGTYGLKIIPYASLSESYNLFDRGFLHELLEGNLEWEYLKPRGLAASEPYRMDDFDGYDSNKLAIPPSGELNGIKIETDEGDIPTMEYTIPEVGETVVSLSDLSVRYPNGGEQYSEILSNMKFGAVFKSMGAQNSMIVKSEEKASTGKHVIALREGSEEGGWGYIQTGTYKFAPFLWSEIEPGRGDYFPMYISLNNKPIDVTVIVHTGLVITELTSTIPSPVTYYTLTITNDSKKIRVAGQTLVRVYRAEWIWSDSLGDYVLDYNEDRPLQTSYLPAITLGAYQSSGEQLRGSVNLGNLEPNWMNTSWVIRTDTLVDGVNYIAEWQFPTPKPSR